MTILAVDDEPLIRTLLATVLQDIGIEVLTADCAAQAITMFHERPDVDLLISDIVMPGMDGLTLATKLRKERPDLGVLLISGYCDREHLSHGFAFLPKPFTVPDMLTAVRALLPGRSRGTAQGAEPRKRVANSPAQTSSSQRAEVGRLSAGALSHMNA